MSLSEIHTELESHAWVTLTNENKSLKRGQVCSLASERGKLQLTTTGTALFITCRELLDERLITSRLHKGYNALVEVVNVAPEGSYNLRIIYIYGVVENLSNISIALSKTNLDQSRKIKLGNNSDEIKIAIKNDCLFKIDEDSNDLYAFIYTSNYASHELNNFEEKNTGEQEKLLESSKVLNNNSIVIIGKTLQLAIREVALGDETYLKCQRMALRTNNHVNRAIRLVKVNLEFDFLDAPKIMQDFARKQMEKINSMNDGYLSTWDKYGTEEGKILLEKAKSTGVIHVIKSEPYGDGDQIKVFVETDYTEILSNNDSLLASNTEPEYLKNTELTWEEYIENELQIHQKKNDLASSLKWPVEESYEQNSMEANDVEDVSEEADIGEEDISEVVGIKKVEKNSLVLNIGSLPKNTTLKYSIFGEKIQVERRMTARQKISEATCAMPILGALIEEGGIVALKERPKKIEPLTRYVEDKIFPKNKPTDMQKQAIDIMLNTPDIALIQGPPGTGKTTVMTAVIERLNEIADKKGGVKGEILVSGYQHDAVDNLTSRLSVNSLPAIKFGKQSGTADAITTTDEKISFWRKQIADAVKNNSPEVMINTQYNSLLHLYSNYIENPNNNKAIILLTRSVELLEATDNINFNHKTKLLIEEIKIQSAPKSEYKIRCIRALRTTVCSFNDDGALRAKELIDALNSDLTDEQQDLLNKVISTSKVIETDLKALIELKRELLLKYKPDIRLNINMLRGDVVQLTQESLNKLAQQAHIKEPKNQILSKYLFNLENNPNGIKKSIADYNLVYGATTGQSEGRELREAKLGRSRAGDVVFGTVMIDEAARAAPRDLMIPMVQAEDRIILVGDHRQLPHMVEDSIVESIKDNEDKSDVIEKHIKHSMFQYLFGRLKELEKQDGIKRTITLDAQFRSHPLLGKFASDQFYEKHGEAYRSDLPADLFSHKLKGIEDKAAVWIDVPNRLGKEEKNESNSTFRTCEANKIAEALSQWIDSEEGKDLSFGIISFYKAQVTEILKALVKYGITEKVPGGYQICEAYKMLKDENGKPTEERLRIGTVDSFQGMEFDIVLLSVVRSCNETQLISKRLDRSIFGHLMSVNRLCVSMTRQKKTLIVFSDTKFVHSSRAENAIPEVRNYLMLCQKEEQSQSVFIEHENNIKGVNNE